MVLTVNDRELDGAMAAIEQVISERQRGIGTYQNKRDPFPRLEAREVRTILGAMCGVSESFARTLIKRLFDQGRLVRSGESTATMYTTPAVQTAATWYTRCMPLAIRSGSTGRPSRRSSA
jgi:hypothetical protein